MRQGKQTRRFAKAGKKTRVRIPFKRIKGLFGKRRSIRRYRGQGGLLPCGGLGAAPPQNKTPQNKTPQNKTPQYKTPQYKTPQYEHKRTQNEYKQNDERLCAHNLSDLCGDDLDIVGEGDASAFVLVVSEELWVEEVALHGIGQGGDVSGGISECVACVLDDGIFADTAVDIGGEDRKSGGGGFGDSESVGIAFAGEDEDATAREFVGHLGLVDEATKGQASLGERLFGALLCVLEEGAVADHACAGLESSLVKDGEGCDKVLGAFEGDEFGDPNEVDVSLGFKGTKRRGIDGEGNGVDGFGSCAKREQIGAIGFAWAKESIDASIKSG